MLRKCLVITSFGLSNRNYVYALLLWGLLLVSDSSYLVKVHSMLNLSALTFEVSVAKLLNSLSAMDNHDSPLKN
jgi:hypothetical protein